MANYKSSLVSAVDSGDGMVGLNNQQNAKVQVAQVTLAAATTTADTICFGRVSVDALIPSIRMWSTDSGTTGTLDIGFHKISDSNTIGDAIDADAIGTAIDIKTAATSNVEVRYETKAITTATQKVWEICGLSARPAYDECFLTGTYAEGADATSGTIVLVTTIVRA